MHGITSKGKRSTTGFLYGYKITREPRHLHAVIAKSAVQIANHHILNQNKIQQKYSTNYIQKSRKYVVEIYTQYINTISQQDQIRWKQYGAPSNPMPMQVELNKLLSYLTRNNKVLWVGLYNSVQVNEKIHTRKKRKEVVNKALLRHVKLVSQHIREYEKELPRFWLDQSEIKALLKEVQEQHERITLQQLANKEHNPSIACRIMAEWSLDRALIKEIMRHLSEDRKLQVTFSNLTGATRFKTKGANNKLYVTICPKCNKELDHWEHHKICYKINVPTKYATRTKIDWLSLIKEYMRMITTETPAKYQASTIRYEDFQKMTNQ